MSRKQYHFYAVTVPEVGHVSLISLISLIERSLHRKTSNKIIIQKCRQSLHQLNVNQHLSQMIGRYLSSGCNGHCLRSQTGQSNMQTRWQRYLQTTGEVNLERMRERLIGLLRGETGLEGRIQAITLKTPLAPPQSVLAA